MLSLRSSLTGDSHREWQPELPQLAHHPAQHLLPGRPLPRPPVPPAVPGEGGAAAETGGGGAAAPSG